MRELIYTVGTTETKSYDMAKEMSRLTNRPIKSKVREIKEENTRAGKFAGVRPKFPYVAPYMD